MLQEYAIWCAIGAVAGFVVGGVVVWLMASGRVKGALDELRERVAGYEREIESLTARLNSEREHRIRVETQLEESQKRLEEEKHLLEEAREKLTDTFKAVAGDTLQSNTKAFIALATQTLNKVLAEAKGEMGSKEEAIKGLIKPISDSLKRFDEQIRSIEKDRQEAYSALLTQVKGLSESQQQLQRETANLVSALRKPQVRGRWGELTLRRVVELSGMSEHCDFEEQVSVGGDTGRRQRPDLVVFLPNSRKIVVDAKVSLDAYLDATEADTETERKEAMKRHAAQVKAHIDSLASKGYWEQFQGALEFVVMFIPSESFFGAAVSADYGLLEYGLKKKVLMSTPTTLLALLKAVAYGWRQEELAANAREISELAKQLYERIRVMAGHFANVGKGLDKATASYNKAVGSLENRVLVTARKFKDLGVPVSKEIDRIEPVDTAAREIRAHNIVDQDAVDIKDEVSLK